MTRLVVRQPLKSTLRLCSYQQRDRCSITYFYYIVFAHSYRFASTVFILSILLLVVSGVYLIAKYSANHVHDYLALRNNYI